MTLMDDFAKHVVVPVPKFAWTDDKVQTLRDHWGTEGHSARTIGLELGVTRCAVIGKAHRLGLDLPPGAPESETMAEARLKRNREAKAMARRLKRLHSGPTIEGRPLPDETADQTIPMEQRKTIVELTPEDCRWIIGDPALGSSGYFFCGGSRVRLSPYCISHHRRAFTHYVRRVG